MRNIIKKGYPIIMSHLEKNENEKRINTMQKTLVKK